MTQIAVCNHLCRAGRFNCLVGCCSNTYPENDVCVSPCCHEHGCFFVFLERIQVKAVWFWWRVFDFYIYIYVPGLPIPKKILGRYMCFSSLDAEMVCWFSVVFCSFFWCGAGYQSPCFDLAVFNSIEKFYRTLQILFSLFVLQNLVVVSNIVYFHPYLGKIPILTNTFQMGWNHQPVNTGHYPPTNRHGTTRRASWKDKHPFKPTVLGFHGNFRGCSSHKVIHLWGVA